jgi:uncharacterized membrane protein
MSAPLASALPVRAVPWHRGPAGLLLFVLLQVGVMLVAISGESLWIDEFWTAHFASLDSWSTLFELLMVPSGSQTPLHFIYYHVWGLLFEPTELALRLANLPLFVLGQVCLFWALRDHDARFAVFMLVLSAMHPMVWQYANEARPYIMMVAGAQMVLAYLLHLRVVALASESSDAALAGAPRQVRPLFTAVFAVGAVLLFGASMLGAFWVLAAAVYIIHLHQRHLGWRYLAQGLAPLWIAALLSAMALLSLYYLNSLLQGGGASRISSTTVATLLFNGYELLGLSGIGPGRLDLRANGMAALAPHAVALFVMTCVVALVLLTGLRAAHRRLGTPALLALGALALLPAAIVVASGFIMHWRVLGRHLVAEVPLLSLVAALGMARLAGPSGGRWRPARVVLALAYLALLVVSAASMRFADRHQKDDYQTAAAIARQGLLDGQQVWWVADFLGAHYHGLPGDFDYMGELTSVHTPPACHDRPGVQAAANLSADCLRGLSEPDLVVLSRPETFDKSGDVVRYLNARGYVKVRDLPAISIWQPPASPKSP